MAMAPSVGCLRRPAGPPARALRSWCGRPCRRCGSLPRSQHTHARMHTPRLPRSYDRVRPVAAADAGEMDVDAFRARAFAAERPLLVRGGAAGCRRRRPEEEPGLPGLPALQRWFVAADPAAADAAADPPETEPAMQLAPYLERFAWAPVAYELLYCPAQQQRRRAGGDGSQQAGDVWADFFAWLRAEEGSGSSGGGHRRPDGFRTADGEAGPGDEDDAVPITMALPTDADARRGLAAMLAWHLEAAGAPAAPSTPPTPPTPRLVRMEAPLALFLAAEAYNRRRPPRRQPPLTQLYVAQASLGALPGALQQDVPAPELVRRAGRGDVYDASLWLGLAPTYTPWHRDPNPNLFCQLCGGKTLRLMPPAAGDGVFRAVQTALAQQRAAAAGNGSAMTARSARIRGEEMMQGPERQLLDDAVWGPQDGSGDDPRRTMYEAHLAAGDALFIPKGWWHSVKSTGADGQLNGSVNWWFR